MNKVGRCCLFITIIFSVSILSGCAVIAPMLAVGFSVYPAFYEDEDEPSFAIKDYSITLNVQEKKTGRYPNNYYFLRMSCNPYAESGSGISVYATEGLFLPPTENTSRVSLHENDVLIEKLLLENRSIDIELMDEDNKRPKHFVINVDGKFVVFKEKCIDESERIRAAEEAEKQAKLNLENAHELRRKDRYPNSTNGGFMTFGDLADVTKVTEHKANTYFYFEDDCCPAATIVRDLEDGSYLATLERRSGKSMTASRSMEEGFDFSSESKALSEQNYLPILVKTEDLLIEGARLEKGSYLYSGVTYYEAVGDIRRQAVLLVK